MEDLSRVPQQLSSVLEMASEEKLRIDVAAKEVGELRMTIESSIDRLVIGMMVSAIVIGLSLVLIDEDPQTQAGRVILFCKNFPEKIPSIHFWYFFQLLLFLHPYIVVSFRTLFGRKPENITMFCQQCEETARGLGCTAGGGCGKSNDTACYQDAVNFILSGLAYRRTHQPAGAKVPADTAKQDKAVVEILFATLTNVNFDKERFKEYLKLLIAYRDAYPKIPGEPKECAWIPKSEEEIIHLEGGIGLLAIEDDNERSLFSLLLFRLKGMCAYYSQPRFWERL